MLVLITPTTATTIMTMSKTQRKADMLPGRHNYVVNISCTLQFAVRSIICSVNVGP